MAKTIKAERATILLGDIPIEVYQLPDGSYKLSGRNVTDAVSEANNTLIRYYGVKSLKDLPSADLERYKVNPGKEGSPFEPVSINDATIFWHGMSKKGNTIADQIIQAALIESIERRADAAFGVQRSEEERNQRFKARVDGIATRRTLTDAIKDFISTHPELSDNAVKFMYSNVTDGIYRSLFGRSCKRLTGDLKVEQDKLRDSLTVMELNNLNAFESMVMRLVDRGSEPLQVGQDPGDFDRVAEIGVARRAHLRPMRLHRKDVRAVQ